MGAPILGPIYEKKKGPEKIEEMGGSCNVATVVVVISMYSF